jgi:hypothetical protein
MIRFAGIYVAAETHMVAVVDARAACCANRPLGGDTAAYRRLREWLKVRMVRWSRWRRLQFTGAIYSLHSQTVSASSW